jgi:uncharacterized protein (DUF2267 family)
MQDRDIENLKTDFENLIGRYALGYYADDPRHAQTIARPLAAEFAERVAAGPSYRPPVRVESVSLADLESSEA